MLYYVKIAFVALLCIPILYLGIRYLHTLLLTATYGKNKARQRREASEENKGDER